MADEYVNRKYARASYRPNNVRPLRTRKHPDACVNPSSPFAPTHPPT